MCAGSAYWPTRSIRRSIVFDRLLYEAENSLNSISFSLIHSSIGFIQIRLFACQIREWARERERERERESALDRLDERTAITLESNDCSHRKRLKQTERSH